MSSPHRTIFVTVGTTLFEDLIEKVTTESAFHWMVSRGYRRLVIQYGKGTKPDLPSTTTTTTDGLLTIECYNFKASLEADMKAADLIISHAGAGTVMECVRLGKRLVVVINTILMDNHQTELANAMGQRRHLFVVQDPKLLSDLKTWDEFDSFQPVPKEPGDEDDFPRLLNQFLGLDKDS
jgi:beta-1,4-N-acetylglucosaminyltransferase